MDAAKDPIFIDIASSSDEEPAEPEGKRNYEEWKKINGCDGGGGLTNVLDSAAIEKIAIENMENWNFERPPDGGARGEKKCEGAVFGDKRGEEDKIVKVSVAQMQPVRLHKDDMEENCPRPESIHEFGASVC